MQFRAAIQLQFDFHRAIYNLGTVLVSPQLFFSVLAMLVQCFLLSFIIIIWILCCIEGLHGHWDRMIRWVMYILVLQYGLAEDLLRIGGSVSHNDISPNDLYSQCAVYIAAAHALKPNYSVSSLQFWFLIFTLPASSAVLTKHWCG